MRRPNLTRWRQVHMQEGGLSKNHRQIGTLFENVDFLVVVGELKTPNGNCSIALLLGYDAVPFGVEYGEPGWGETIGREVLRG